MSGKKIFISIALLTIVIFSYGQQHTLTLPIGHNNPIESVDKSPNGKYVISKADDNSVILWDRFTGKAIRRFYLQEAQILCLKFSGNQSFAVLYPGLLVNYDLATGSEIYRKPLDAGVNEFVVDAGRLILFYKKVGVSLEVKLNGHQPLHNEILFVDSQSGKLQKKIKGRYPASIDTSSDYLVATNLENDILIYNKASGSLLHTITFKSGEIESLKNAYPQVIVQTNEGEIISVALNGGTRSLHKHPEKTGAIALSLSNHTVFSGFMKTLLLTNYNEALKTDTMLFRWNIDNVYYDPQTPDLLFVFFETGGVMQVNFKTKTQISGYRGHTNWNGQFLPLGNNDFITYCSDIFFRSWQADPLLPLNRYGGTTSPVSYVSLDNTHGTILTALSGGPLSIREQSTFHPVKTNLPQNMVESVSPLYGDSVCVLTYRDKKVLFYDTKHNEAFDSFLVENLGEVAIQSTDDQSAILFQGSMTIHAISRNNIVQFRSADNTLAGEVVAYGLKSVQASRQDKYLLIKATHCYLYNTEDSVLKGFAEYAIPMQLAQFSFDEEKILYTETNRENILQVLDISTGISTVVSIGNFAYLALSPPNEKNQIVAASPDSLKVINLDRSKGERSFAINLGSITAMTWKDSETLILGNEDGQLFYLNVRTNKFLYTQVLFEDGDYMIVNNQNYYTGSHEKIKNISFVSGLEVTGFDQLDIRYNRPDLILKSIGNTDTALINSYHKAYLKRIKKLSIDTTRFGSAFGVPQTDIVGRDKIEFEQKKQGLTIHLKGSDKLYKLDRLNIWVNDVPVFGMKGLSLRHKNISAFDTSINIILSSGLNVIEASVINVNGTESYRSPLTVKYEPKVSVPEKLYFIGIGIDSFQQAGHGLSWSVKDIRDLTDSLSKKYGSQIVVDTFFNRDVTIENITRLKTKLLASGVNDKVIVSYSGHGLLSKDYDYYLSTYQVNFEKPEENGLPYEALENLLDGIPARKKLMLIDACHSGEVDKEEMEKYVMVEKTLEDSGTKSSRKPVLKDGRVGMQNSFELMQQLFVNVGRSTGATVISAAAGTQFAQEQADLQNGVFTYSILEYMKTNPSATVTELRRYVNKRVTELTNGMQVPTTRSETKAVDWRVW